MDSIENYLNIPEFFLRFFNNAQKAAIMVMNTEGIILKANFTVRSSFGYSQEELVGQYFHVLFIAEDRNKKLPEIELSNVMQKGSWTDNQFLLHKNGAHIWVHGESVLTNDDKGELFIIKVIFDINQQKMLEKFLVASEEKLRMSNQGLQRIINDLDNFVYTASHDLKGPVNNIQGLINGIDEEVKGGCDKQVLEELLELVHLSIDKFRKTLNDLSQIGRVKDYSEDLEVLNIKEIFDDIKFDLQEEVKRSGALLFEKFDSLEVRLAKKNLRSILYNLTSNAIKYRHPDRPLNIYISSNEREGQIVVQVRDNGLGLDDTDKEKIFSFYKRVHHHIEGTGIGLSIVKSIVDNVGGRIEVESRLGEGSTFSIFLPK